MKRDTFKHTLQRLLRQLAYLLVFGWFAVMKATELFAFFPAYRDPIAYARRVALRESFAATHLIAASALIGLTILFSVLTVANVLQQARSVTLTARLAGICIILNGGYLLYVGYTQMTGPAAGLTGSLAGIVYIVIGAAVFGLAPKASRL